jgi:predicted AlkP superfamily pyrophosphatase or phosphodiesterase
MRNTFHFTICLLLVFCHCETFAQPRQEKPGLVVGICVDQMRWDYLQRFYHRFGERGFHRLAEEGFSFENAFINYAPSVTAAGHASIYTGAIPALHGIAANDWISDSANLPMNAVRDSAFITVGSETERGRAGPLRLWSSTIGDELKLAAQFSNKVFSVAWKDRASILPGGRGANAAFWFDEKAGKWVSSSYYMSALPDWLENHNSKLNADSFLNINWNLLKAASGYVNHPEDAAPWEKNFPGEAKPAFPHVFSKDEKGGYSNLGHSPQSQKLTFDLAKLLIEKERLGMGRQTDMLCLSLSALDLVGHLTGPNSLEVEDLLLRLDEELSIFMRFLDKRVGKDNYLLFLTSDHGVSHATGFLGEHHLSSGNLRLKSLVKDLNDSCNKKFGVEPVLNIMHYQIYLDEEKVKRSGNDINLVEKHIIQIMKQKDAVMQAFSYREFEKVIMPMEVKRMFANGYVAGRSGDIQIVLKPGYTDRFSQGGDHASWYNYDTKIPVLFYGWHIPAGRSFRRVSITDIAPTISALLGIQPPNAATGEVLEEVVR